MSDHTKPPKLPKLPGAASRATPSDPAAPLAADRPRFDRPLPDHPLLRGATLRPSGEAAVAIELGDTIDDALWARARALADAFEHAAPPGLLAVVPTYRSVLVEFDPERTDATALLAALPADAATGAAAERRTWEMPVCLDDEHAEDLGEVCAATGLGAGEVRARLLASPLTVGMFGFVPGFAYWTGLDPALHVPRRAAPRSPVAPGTLIVAAGQAALVPVSMPTGWYAVGRSAARIFDPAAPERGEPPSPLAPGDAIRLVAVDAGRLAALADDPMGGLRVREP